MPCMQERVHGRRRTVQARQQGRVRLPRSVPLGITHGSRSYKRLTQRKKQKERGRKDLDVLGRQRFVNVRVVQRNMVYIVNMGPRFEKEEVSTLLHPDGVVSLLTEALQLIPTFRSNEYFGQYGKISKIVIVKWTTTGRESSIVGLYITYHRKEDAARCIGAVDCTTPLGGCGEIMRASYGTKKYCIAFLCGRMCSNRHCMDLHKWGDEGDCFTKEDLIMLYVLQSHSPFHRLIDPQKTYFQRYRE